jgi:serine-type D-Ala-D-Ala carboxypeptidase (penicillin-binding protein 5/6)
MKKNKIISLILTLTFIVGAFSNVYAEQAPSLNVNAKSAILIEPSTGKIILEQNIYEELPLASVTKVMTMLLIYEAVEAEKIKWDDIVTVSDYAAGMGGSQVFLEAMEQQSVRDLTKAISVASGNDAAVAMAEFIAGSEEGFVILMNQRAKELGMKNTNFKNACGLDEDGHYSSAYDISLMSRELTINHPQVFDFTQIWMDTIVHKTARGEEEFGLANTNKLIKSYKSATGLKTGSTSEALFCISATASRDNLDLIAVVLGAEDSSTRFNEAIKMLDFGFATYSVILGEEAGTEKGLVKIFKGDMTEVPVVIKDQVNCLVLKGKDVKLESKIELVESLNAPIKRGTKAGELIYYSEEKEVGRVDLVTGADVEKANLKNIMDWIVDGWFGSVNK